MNRIDSALANLQARGQKMLSPYITAGDPTPKSTVPLMHALVSAGADVLEIGIPFSDPMAEGVVIQGAMERALSHGVTGEQVLEMVRVFRQKDTLTPIVIMGYLNPIAIYGYEQFARKAQEVGVDGTIIVDLPPEESALIEAVWRKFNLYSIYLCSPTTTLERMQLINGKAQGYLYYVSLKGVTGSSDFDLAKVLLDYQQRKAQTSLPLMIGFGIKTATMAANIAKFADGVIVGAALISEILTAHQAEKDIIIAGGNFIKSMRRAMDDKTVL